MAGVRVIVTLNFPSAEIAAQVATGMVEANRPIQKRAGALQYEVFRSAENPEKVVLLEHWASRELYDRHWTKQLEAGPPDLDPSMRPTCEFYAHQNYNIDKDGFWFPQDSELRNRTIRWA